MSNNQINRSDLIQQLSIKHQFSADLAENMVHSILNEISTALANNQRVEIRDFGAFEVRERAERTARNPRTGETVTAPAKNLVHFKPGKALRERVDEKRQKP